MISPETRKRLESICSRIENHEEVSFEEMTWAQKWASHNRVAARMLNQARRVSIQGKPKEGSLDEFLNALDLGDPDPQNHRIGPQDPVDLGMWFRRGDDDEWIRHD